MGGYVLNKIELKIPLENIENILGTVTSPSIVISELIKNSIDSNSSYIRIDIYTNPRNQIVILDHGDGLSFKDIEKLSLISESNKKVNGNLQRKDGSYLTGSKGLGILSLFSIANKFTMETERGKVRYCVEWTKGQRSFTCEQIEPKNKNGTELLITDIDNEYISILTDENELNKLKHISIKNFINSNLDKKTIDFFINGKECTELKIQHLNDLVNNFIGSIIFKYKADTNTLDFQYRSINNLINSSAISIKLDNSLSISKILVNNYKLSQVYYKGEPCKYLDFPLESFYGEIHVTEQKRNAELHNFGPGVKVFVNQFAMYGYLDSENDWLNFSVYSMTRKNTRYKPHNVFGYVHFENLNENESYVKISNERAYFIENGAFKKFQEIMKNIITALAFNIDVAEKNGWIVNSSSTINLGDSKGKQAAHTDFSKQNSNSEENHSQSMSTAVNTNTSANKTQYTEGKPKNQVTETSNNSNSSFSDSTESTNVTQDKKPVFNFFKSSRILKHSDEIELVYDELISQLSKLDYKKFYLLFVIAFRAIIEDISKKYLNARGIKLYGDFGQNVKQMTDDILSVIRDPNLIDAQDKIFIENLLGGFNAFKNYFETTGAEFYNNGKQGIKAIALNSFTHTPRWMEIEEAENMANNVILPLHMISKEIIGRIKVKD